MMAVAILGALNAESFCECVLSCLKLVVSDLHVRLKTDEIRMFVMLRMNQEFMELGLFVDKDNLISYQLLII